MTSNKLVDSNKGVFAISIVLIIGSLSFAICKYRCDCDAVEGFDLFMYVIFALALGVTLIALGISIQSEANKTCKSVVKSSQIIWGIGAAITGISTIYLGYQAYEKYKTGDWGGDPARARRTAAAKSGVGQLSNVGSKYYGSSGDMEKQLRESKVIAETYKKAAGRSEAEIAALKAALKTSNAKLINHAEEVRRTGERHKTDTGDRVQQAIPKPPTGSSLFGKSFRPSSAPSDNKPGTWMEMKRTRGGG